MGTVSAAGLFSEAFNWFASLSAKMPSIDFKTFFIVVVALLIGVGVVVGLTYFGSYRFKLLLASRKIIRYLADADSIDDDNVKDFTDQCFSAKAPTVLCDSWKLYLGVRFGYPSDIVSESTVYDKVVKRVREVRASVYIGIALVLIAAFAFWGYGTLDGSDMGVIFCAGLLLSGAMYILLVMLNRLLSKRCLEVFDEMQIELDAKVDLQVDKSYATDSSPLAELSAMLDEIIARNTAKNVGFELNVDEETPIEKLIANAQQSEDVIDIADFESDFYEIEKYEEELEGGNRTDKTDGEHTDKSDTQSDESNDGDSEDTYEDEDGVDGQKETDGSQDGEASEEVIDVDSDSKELSDTSEGEEKEDANEIEQTDEVTPSEEAGEETEAQEEDNSEDIEEVADESSEESTQNSEHSEESVESNSGDLDEDTDNTDESEDDESYSDELDDDSDSDSDDNDDDVDEEDESFGEDDAVEDDESLSDESQSADDVETSEENFEEDSNDDESDDSNDDDDEVEDEAYDDEDVDIDDSESVDEDEGADEERENENSTEPTLNALRRNENGIEVREIIDYTEDDEYVKPARLVKLPNLVDYVIANNPSPTMLINVSRLMLIARSKFEHSREDRRIVDNCIGKLIVALHNAYMTTKL